MMERDYYFDNIKFVLIMLVVIGHIIGPVNPIVPAYKAIYVFIYLFHMPLFAFISGYFTSKKIKPLRILKLLGLYVVGTCFYVTAFDLGSILYNIIEAQTPLWYLLSLCCWTLLLPLFDNLRDPIPLTIVSALLIGLVPWVDYTFSLSRTLVFLPFFIAGNLYRRGTLTMPRKIHPILTLICSGFFVWYMLAKDLPSQLLLFVLPYHNMDEVFVRFVLFSLGTMLAVNIMASIPKNKTFYTLLGANTLFVYLSHEIFINAFKIIGIYQKSEFYIFLVPCAIVLTFVLSAIPIFYQTHLASSKSLVIGWFNHKISEKFAN